MHLWMLNKQVYGLMDCAVHVLRGLSLPSVLPALPPTPFFYSL